MVYRRVRHTYVCLTAAVKHTSNTFTICKCNLHTFSRFADICKTYFQWSFNILFFLISVTWQLTRHVSIQILRLHIDFYISTLYYMWLCHGSLCISSFLFTYLCWWPIYGWRQLLDYSIMEKEQHYSIQSTNWHSRWADWRFPWSNLGDPFRNQGTKKI